MNKDLITTTIYAYKDNLFIGYLNGSFSIFPLNEKKYHHQYNKEYFEYNSKITSNIGVPIKIQAYKDYLFVASSKSIHSFYLKNNGIWEEVFSKEIPRCINICIDRKKGLLFGVSQTRGLVVIDIRKPSQPTYKTDIGFMKLDLLKKYHVADIDVFNGTFFLALRNYGILRVDYKENKFGEIEIFQSLKKIDLSDPQDVKFSKINDSLYISDAEMGFIMLNIKTGEVVLKELPTNDKPVEILILKGNAIIKGNKGVYYFNHKTLNIEKLLNFDIGPVTSYYNNLYFTHESKLGRIRFNHSNNKSMDLSDDLFEYDYQFINGQIF